MSIANDSRESIDADRVANRSCHHFLQDFQPFSKLGPGFFFRKALVSVIVWARNSGAGNGCANFVGTCFFFFFRSFCKQTSMPIKFLVFLGGGGYFFFFFLGGGGEVPILFLWARGFSDFLQFENLIVITLPQKGGAGSAKGDKQKSDQKRQRK